RGGRLTDTPAQRVAQEREKRRARPRAAEREWRAPVGRHARVDERLPVRGGRVAVAERQVGDLAAADRQRVAERARLAVALQRAVAVVAEAEAGVRILREPRGQQQPT